eukprot:tig00000025_g7935.t1
MSLLETGRTTRPRPIPLEVGLPLQRIELTAEEISARAAQRQAEQEAQRKAQAEIPIPQFSDVPPVDNEAERGPFDQTQEFFRWRESVPIVEYDYDSDDERWVASNNSSVKKKYHVGLEHLEMCIDALEKESGKKGYNVAISLAEAYQIFHKLQSHKVTDAIYNYWTWKRMKLGNKSLFRQFRAPPDPNDPRPDVAFRPRKWVSADTPTSTAGRNSEGPARPRRPPPQRRGEAAPAAAAAPAASSSSSPPAPKGTKAPGGVREQLLRMKYKRGVRTIRRSREFLFGLYKTRTLIETVIKREKVKKDLVKLKSRIRRRQLASAARRAMSRAQSAPSVPPPAPQPASSSSSLAAPPEEPIRIRITRRPTEEELQATAEQSMDFFRDPWGGPLPAFDRQAPFPHHLDHLPCVEVALVVRRSDLLPGERWEPLPPSLAAPVAPRPSPPAPPSRRAAGSRRRQSGATPGAPRASGRLGRGGASSSRAPPPRPWEDEPREPPAEEPVSAAAPEPYPRLDPSLDAVVSRLYRRLAPPAPPRHPRPRPSSSCPPSPRPLRPPCGTSSRCLYPQTRTPSPRPAPVAAARPCPRPPLPPPCPSPLLHSRQPRRPERSPRTSPWPPRGPSPRPCPPSSRDPSGRRPRRPPRSSSPTPPTPPATPSPTLSSRTRRRPPRPAGPAATPRTPARPATNGHLPHSRKSAAAATLAVPAPKAGPARNGLSRKRPRSAHASPPFRDGGHGGDVDPG